MKRLIALMLVWACVVPATAFAEPVNTFPACTLENGAKADYCAFASTDMWTVIHPNGAITKAHAGDLVAAFSSPQVDHEAFDLRGYAYALRLVVTARVVRAGLDYWFVWLDASGPDDFPWECKPPDPFTPAQGEVCIRNPLSPFWNGSDKDPLQGGQVIIPPPKEQS